MCVLHSNNLLDHNGPTTNRPTQTDPQRTDHNGLDQNGPTTTDRTTTDRTASFLCYLAAQKAAKWRSKPKKMAKQAKQFRRNNDGNNRETGKQGLFSLTTLQLPCNKVRSGKVMRSLYPWIRPDERIETTIKLMFPPLFPNQMCRVFVYFSSKTRDKKYDLSRCTTR